MDDVTEAREWERSSFCSDSACAEVARDGDDVLIRNSQQPDNVVRFTRAEWAAFLQRVAAGEFA